MEIVDPGLLVGFTEAASFIPFVVSDCGSTPRVSGLAAAFVEIVSMVAMIVDWKMRLTMLDAVIGVVFNQVRFVGLAWMIHASAR